MLHQVLSQSSSSASTARGCCASSNASKSSIRRTALRMFSERSSLGLAAAGRASIGCAVGRSSCSDTVSDTSTRGRKTPASFTNSWHLLVLHLHQRACSPAAALGHRLLVCGEVEGEEEEEVRRDDADAGDGSKLLTSTLAHVGHVWPVGACEVSPRGEVDEACTLLVSAISNMGRT